MNFLEVNWGKIFGVIAMLLDAMNISLQLAWRLVSLGFHSWFSEFLLVFEPFCREIVRFILNMILFAKFIGSENLEKLFSVFVDGRAGIKKIIRTVILLGIIITKNW